ncbi:hypothetical protein B0T16DRAFT_197272 [Cercophora newfieldiana]|uniref:Uncharacterized protein n=1 Tax=Cercophora newfieldiana TaxID=92897 RepID=A0AA40CMJ7_9PEZI|nr:hypothetical protein B0T16DRAFT_197272 [Cercophora newfieldiana]
MEAVGAIAAFLAAAEIATQCLRLAKVLRSVRDDKYDQLYWRMELQKTRTVEWAKLLQAANFTPPPSQEQRFMNLLHGLATRFRELEAVLKKLSPQGASERRMSIRMAVITRRLMFEYGVFEEMSDKLKTIETMNDNLEILARVHRVIVPVYALEHSAVVKGVVTVQEGIDQEKHLSAPDVSTHDHAAGSSAPVEVEPEPLPFYSTFQTGTKTLEKLLKVCPNEVPVESAGKLLSRFNLWGSSVFEDKDSLFDAELDLGSLWSTPAGQRQKGLGIYVMKTLVDIIIAERKSGHSCLSTADADELISPVFILDKLVLGQPEGSKILPELQSIRSQLLIVLVADEVMDLARQRFEELYPSWNDDESGAESDGEEVQAEDDIEDANPMTGWEDRVAVDEAPPIPSSLIEIEASIDCLYATLSSISRCRQSHLLDLEAQRSRSAQAAATLAEADSDPVSNTTVFGTPIRTSSTLSNSSSYFHTDTPSTTPSASINMDQHRELVRRNLALVKDLRAIFEAEERFDQQTASKTGKRKEKPTPTIRVFSPCLTKEVHRLEKYYKNLLQPNYAAVPKPEEVQAALAQNNAGLRMVKYMMEGSSALGPKKTAMSGKTSVDVIQTAEEQIESMLKEFVPNSFQGLRTMVEG